MPANDLRRRVRHVIESTSLRPRIRRVSLFGSHAEGMPRPDSDIDLLVEFRSPVGYFGLAHLQRELERSLLKAVDLLTPGCLSPYLRGVVLGHALPVYES